MIRPGLPRRGTFIQAHLDRLQDARTLLKARRWGGGIYLAGYVVECLLKAALLSRRGLLTLPSAYWHHDLQRLVDEAGLRPAFRRPEGAATAQCLALLCGRWQVSMRYGTGVFLRRDAEETLAAVEVIRKWLLDRI